MVSTGEVKPLKTKYCLRTSSETFDLIMTQDASKQKTTWSSDSKLTVTDFNVIPWYVPLVSILKPSVSIKEEKHNESFNYSALLLFCMRLSKVTRKYSTFWLFKKKPVYFKIKKKWYTTCSVHNGQMQTSKGVGAAGQMTHSKKGMGQQDRWLILRRARGSRTDDSF